MMVRDFIAKAEIERLNGNVERLLIFPVAIIAAQAKTRVRGLALL
jgi:hypothetical protein